MKFNTGDKVRITQDLNEHGYLIGETVTIKGFDGYETFNNYTEECYEVVNDNGRIRYVWGNEVELIERTVQNNLIDPKDHALVFVQKEAGTNWIVYQDGKEVLGLKEIDISADIEYPTEHKFTLVTGSTSDRN